jgi:hypothetical protein
MGLNQKILSIETQNICEACEEFQQAVAWMPSVALPRG